jgi:hypothetical protein
VPLAALALSVFGAHLAARPLDGTGVLARRVAGLAGHLVVQRLKRLPTWIVEWAQLEGALGLTDPEAPAPPQAGVTISTGDCHDGVGHPAISVASHRTTPAIHWRLPNQAFTCGPPRAQGSLTPQLVGMKSPILDVVLVREAMYVLARRLEPRSTRAARDRALRAGAGVPAGLATSLQAGKASPLGSCFSAPRLYWLR